VDYLDELRNWGRWGEADEAGTLNHLTPERSAAAAATVVEGRSVSCAWPIDPRIEDVYGAPQRLMLAGGAGPRSQPLAPGVQERQHGSAAEYLGLAFHGLTVTHLDAPAHVSYDDRLYNGRPRSSVTFDRGATASAVTAAQGGIVARGVLLDVAAARGVDSLLAGHAVTPEELDDCQDRQGVAVGPGDVVLLRTGRTESPDDVRQLAQRPERKSGWSYQCLPWLFERDVAMIGSDGINDAVPSGCEPYGLPLPVHIIGLVAMGLWLLDTCYLEELGRTCSELRRWSFLLTVAPLRLAGGTGSPVNPIATF
jgi:kynurenine formamidase